MRVPAYAAVFSAGLAVGALAPAAIAAAGGSPPMAEAFTEDHPQDKAKQITYLPLAGGEETTYWRGAIQLQYGRVRVEHPRHFSLVSSEQGLSVLITPSSGCSSPVVVKSVNIDAFELVQPEGKDSCTVYFMVMGSRRGHEKFEAVHPRGVRR